MLPLGNKMRLPRTTGTQSGIKNVPEGLDALYSMTATERVASGLHWMARRMIWGQMLWSIRNREGSKRGGEKRHRAGGRISRTEWFMQ